MDDILKADICVIGAGSAGLSVASGAAMLGAKVVLIERDRMGGECLNSGCVPSKALLASAKAAHAVRDAGRFGIDAIPDIHFERVQGRIRSVIDAIAPHDSVERFRGMGVTVLSGQASFDGPRTIRVGGKTINARRMVIATGSFPKIPSIPGLENVSYFTNETIFENGVLPGHLIILGAGPIGLEIGQAYRRLGSQVTIVDHGSAMKKDDVGLSRRLLHCLTDEGVTFLEDTSVCNVSAHSDGLSVQVEQNGKAISLNGTHLMIAAGRSPRIEGLNLQAAAVDFGERGIAVDRRLRTSNRRVFAAGDVVDAPHFTHVCLHHAGVVIRNALFGLPAKVDYSSLPWVTYTDPELAQIGMTEEVARKKHGKDVRIVAIPFASNDRAVADGKTAGTLKLIAHRRGHVLGASILGSNAGELAHVWVVAIQKRLHLRDLAQMIAPYPTLGELTKAAASEFSRPLLKNSVVQGVVRLLSWLP